MMACGFAENGDIFKPVTPSLFANLGCGRILLESESAASAVALNPIVA